METHAHSFQRTGQRRRKWPGTGAKIAMHFDSTVLQYSFVLCFSIERDNYCITLTYRP